MTTKIKSKQLRLLLNDFELLSNTTMTQFQIASKLFENNTIDVLYEEAEANEIIIDRLEIKVREEVVFSIFQFNPVAADLRKIITYQDVTTNLERIGDMLLNIIHFLKVLDLNHPAFLEIKKLLARMFKAVDSMLRDAIQSFLNEDTAAAYKVISDDDKIDEMFREVLAALKTSFAGQSLGEDMLKIIMVFNSMSHNLERIGDSATNIAEATVYLTEGKDIRHGNNK